MTSTLLPGSGHLGTLLEGDEVEKYDDIVKDLHDDQVPSIHPRIRWKFFQQGWKNFQRNNSYILLQNEWYLLITSNNIVALLIEER